MPRIAILNPNSTVSMTDDMVEIGRLSLAQGTEVIGLTNAAGPPAIQGHADAEACLPGLFALADTPLAAKADAVVIGCFDDTGLAAFRTRLRCPVVGLGEASMLLACLAAPRFAVLTTTSGSVPVIEENIERLGLAPRCDAVRASGIPVLDLQTRQSDLVSAIAGLSQDTGTGAIVLGCAGMGRLAPGLAAPNLPVLVDPVRAALTLAQSAIGSTFGGADETTGTARPMDGDDRRTPRA